MSEVKPIPERYSTVTPSLTCDGCADAVAFYRGAFGSEVDRGAVAPGLGVGDVVALDASFAVN